MPVASGVDFSAAEVVLIATSYHDTLVVTNFRLAVPADAILVGFQFEVRQDSLSGESVDGAVQIVKDGVPVGTSHARTEAWSSALTYIAYGGPNDTWGASLTPADVRSTGFGVAIAPKFTGATGNDRAHIDSVRATVFYKSPCD